MLLTEHCGCLPFEAWLDRRRDYHFRVGVVVGKRKMRRTEFEYVFHGRVERYGGEGARLASAQFFHRIELIMVDVGVGEGMHELLHRIADDVCKHHAERGILDDVGNYADRNIGAPLEMMDDQLFRVGVGEDVNPSVARGDDDFARESFVLNRVLRDPRRYEMSAKEWTLLYLLYHMRYLIERGSFFGGETPTCRSIGAVSQISFRQAEHLAFFFGDPAIPKHRRHPILFEVAERPRAV